jgi:hypothetical protein
MSGNTRYTKELLEPIVKECYSVAQVLRKLGKRQAGSIATNLSKRIKKLGIDTSHFLGQGANRGPDKKGGTSKKSWQSVLVLNTHDRREHAFRLRRSLVEYGREYKCETCGISEWNYRELVLQVDHKNRNWSDNQPENLRFQCPNCHSQTDGHSGSQGLTDLFSTARYDQEIRARKTRKT